MGIFAQQQIKHLKGWALGKKSGDDFIERTKRNLPDLWDGELAESFCAKGDGSTGYVTFPNASISGVSGSDWSIAFLIKHDSFSGGNEFVFGTYDTTGATKRFYSDIQSGAVRLQIGTGTSVTLTGAGYMSTGISYLGMLQYSNSTGKITSKFKNMSTDAITDGVEYTVVGLTEMNDNLLGILANANGFSLSTGSVANFRVWFSSISFENMQNLYYGTGANLNVDFNGSVLDKSGNDYHGTVHGTVDLYER